MNIVEIMNRWPNQEAAISHLERIRWGGRPICPYCKSDKVCVHASKDRALPRWQCWNCKQTFSATVGTIFHHTHLPLQTWFLAIAIMLNAKKNVSNLQLARDLNLPYKTAWSLALRIRIAMLSDPAQKRLFHGIVEMDETYIGGERPGKRGRGAAGKSLVVIAAQADGEKKIGRIRLLRVSSAAEAHLTPAVVGMVQPGSSVRTDDWNGYQGLPAAGYEREILRPTMELGENLLPRCHRVASLLKRWLLGTHQGAVRPKQLDYYLDEFTFRFNRRNSQSRGKSFYRLAQQAVQVEPSP
jgi:transposase-like protein